jgi:hypothetical protein
VERLTAPDVQLVAGAVRERFTSLGMTDVVGVIGPRLEVMRKRSAAVVAGVYLAIAVDIVTRRAVLVGGGPGIWRLRIATLLETPIRFFRVTYRALKCGIENVVPGVQ